MALGLGFKSKKRAIQQTQSNQQSSQPSTVLEQNLQHEPIIEANQDSPNINSDDAVISVPPKRATGPIKGLGFEKFIKGNNKMVIDIPKGKGRPISEVQSAKLSFEIEVISHQFIPIPTKWKGMTNDDKNHAIERLKIKFEIDLNNEYVQSSVMSILSKLSRNQRHKLHLYYKSLPSDQEARQKPPPKFNLTQENWKTLCDLFSNPEYQARCEKNKLCRQKVKSPHNQRSEAFVASCYSMRNGEEEPDRMEFFKKNHYLEAKAWINPKAPADYRMQELLSQSIGEGMEPRTIYSVVDEVLGTRSGYIKGIGYGSKPNKQTPNLTISKLSEQLKKTQHKLKEYKLNFESVRDHMKIMTEAMIGYGMQVPML